MPRAAGGCPETFLETSGTLWDGNTKTYGGQFHFDYPGLKDRPIFGMSGYAGNVILMDPVTSKIVVLHSIHHKDKKSSKYYYDFKKVVLDVFK